MTNRLISFVSVSTLALALAACGGETTESAGAKAPLIAKSFEIAMNPAPGRPAAGYGFISGPAGASLTGASSSEAGRVELHIIERDGDIAKMKMVKSMPIDDTNTLTLAKGGAHLMLFDVADSAADDGVVPLTLTFDSGASLSVEAKIAGSASMH